MDHVQPHLSISLNFFKCAHLLSIKQRKWMTPSRHFPFVFPLPRGREHAADALQTRNKKENILSLGKECLEITHRGITYSIENISC